MPPQVHARKGTISKVDERVQWGEYMGDNTQITRRVRKYVCIDKVRKKQTEIKGAEPSRRLGLLLRSSGLKVRRAQVDFATSGMAEVFEYFKD